MAVAVIVAAIGVSPVAAQFDYGVRGPAQSQCHFYRNVQRIDTCYHGLVLGLAAVELQRDSSVGVILIDGSATSDERPGIEARRAENALGYLVHEMAVPADRIVLRWNRVSRASIGKWGGTMRVLVIRSGDQLPAYSEDDLAWQRKTP